MAQDKAAGLLGLAVRAGQLAHGETACELMLRKGGAALVLLDGGASGNTRKKFTDACAYRGITLRELEPGLLGAAIGKHRMVAALPPGPLAQRLEQLLEARGAEATTSYK